VVRSSKPRSRARCSLERKIAVAPSVTTAPVGNKARTMVMPSAAEVPVTSVHTEPVPPMEVGRYGATATRTPSITR
jgi:hypothetical protein